MTMEKINGKILLAQMPLKKLTATIVLCLELEEVYGGLPLYKLCIKSIERGRKIKRQIVPVVGEKGHISNNTIQTAIGQFHSFY